MDLKFLNNHLLFVQKYFVFHIILDKRYVFHLKFHSCLFSLLFSYLPFSIQFFSLVINCIKVLIFFFYYYSFILHFVMSFNLFCVFILNC